MNTKMSDLNILTIQINGMTCAACVSHVKDAIESVDGVISANVNLVTEKALIRFESSNIPSSAILKSVAKAGYEAPTITTVLNIEGMTCAACVSHVKNAIESVDGVISANVNLVTEKAMISHLPDTSPFSSLRDSVRYAGYNAWAASDYYRAEDESGQPYRHRELSNLKQRIILSSGLGIILFLGCFEGFPWVSRLMGSTPYLYLLWALSTPVQFWAGWAFYVSAFSSLRRKTSNMNTLIALGTSTAYFYSVFIVLIRTFTIPVFDFVDQNSSVYFETSAMITAIILIGKMLETKAKAHSNSAIDRLNQLRPNVARVTRQNNTIDLEVGLIEHTDIVVISPGELIPVDGEVINGHSTVDESMLTGTNIPVEKYYGQPVYCGTINHSGSLHIRVTAVGNQTILSGIIGFIEEAQSSKTKIQQYADQVASIFVPFVLITAFISSMFWLLIGPDPNLMYALLVAIAVMIVACPCALGLATPIAITIAAGRGTGEGVLIRDASALEMLHKVNIIVFDKTGTLSTTNPVVTHMIPKSITKNELLRIAASIERNSEHPFGQAIVNAALTKNIDLYDSHNYEIIPGLGIRAVVKGSHILMGNEKLMEEHKIVIDIPEPIDTSPSITGKTPVFVSSNAKFLGVIIISETLRPEVKEVTAKLRGFGIKTFMLTGDTKTNAEVFSKEAGLDGYFAEILPSGKANIIKELQIDQNVVAMVGDGVNDAPALVQADIGISLASGTDIAIKSSSISIIGGDLRAIVKAFILSRKTMTIIKQNLFWAFFYNIALIPVAAGVLYPLFNALGGVPSSLEFFVGTQGFLNPVLAAVAMAFSSLSVISNAMRLKRPLLVQ